MVVFGFAFTASLALLPKIIASPALNKPFYWFSFGDSYTQTGFNITTGPLPSPGNPMGNPPYPGDTATLGENWIDVATTKYNNSLVLTYNFGYSGATVSRDIVPPFADYVRTLPDQIDELVEWNTAQHPQPWTSSNALFSIWIGINDIDLTYAQDIDHSALTDQLITRYFHYAACLQYDLGGRNFLFLNVPPLDRTPELLVQNITVRESEARIIAYYNAQLAAGVDKFKASHNGVQTWQYDAHAAFEQVLDHPEQYGFNNITGDDGVTPGQFWYNWLHPVSAAQVIFGKEVGELLDGTPW
ncbi:Carbohydrate esterase family 16 protein [Mycena sanguinolenta]|uniref:Carbohydrate esterase family 16 protein n=1 Tax=Mycena sanguinolenta TaxID=230812 RepID=A0A8H6Z962_9AGAR|nr:Carbohydrate esterase family 16 protein [Mycena sanguinolenta]